jgi:hypothetical protein
MKACETIAPRFAICVGNREHPASLELHKADRVVPDQDAEQDGDMRIVDASGEDYLYPASYFVLLELPRSTTMTLSKAYAPATYSG